MIRKVLIALALGCQLNATAQMGRLFDADQQMSSSFTTQVYLDQSGFIWVATRNGLNRYDGYQFKILKKEREQDLGMASNYVNCMLQDRRGLFYIGMYGALQTYDGERFQNIETYDLEGHAQPHYITCLLERHNGDILIGTSGHGILKMTGPTTAHQMQGEPGQIKTVHQMMEDSKGRLWVITENAGLICHDGRTAAHYFHQESQRSTVRSVCEDRNGHIYVGTSNAGLFRLDGEQAVHIEGTGNKHISTLYLARNGHIMIGYDGMGMAIYNPQDGQLRDNPYYSRQVDLSRSKVYSIAEDRSGNVWLGLLQKGIYMQPARLSGFEYMGYKLGTRNVIGSACVTSVLISSKGLVWIGTDKDGLYCLTTAGQVLKHFKEQFPASILGLTEDLQGNIWIGSYKEGCGRIDSRTMSYQPYALPQGSNVSVFDLEADRQGRIWMATMGYGLLRLTPQSGDIKAYTMAPDAGANRQQNSIANNYISQLALSPDGKRIYVATTMGVGAMDLASENWLSTFGVNCLNYGTATRIAREFGGKLYVGTNDGLVSYDLKRHTLDAPISAIGLTENGISSIEQDRLGRLWIATDHGLYCRDVKTGETNAYFVDNGLQSNEFSDGASSTSASGKMLFGGLGGVTWFDPAKIEQSEWKAEVMLTSLSVNGQVVTTSTESGFWTISKEPVITSNHFDLSYNDNSFALQLSTLTYDSPEHITYLYRIDNEEWVAMQPGVNEITFSHMQPGTYHFCVVAQRNGVQTPERCFTVVIHAPWYRTTVAYLIYLLAISAAVWIYLRFRRRKEQDHLRLQEHIHAEEMADAKLRFFMNISHEIRTPMTLILTPLLSLIKDDKDPQRNNVYETIRRNAERILGLINQMMDLRKIDKGLMQMHMRETDLISFVGDIYALFGQQAKTKSMKFVYEHDCDTLPVWIDRGNFDKIIVNLLSNSFKFTPPGGEISIHITHDEQQGNAQIVIRDNGEGIPEDKLERIFERFYQTPSSVNDRKTGTGIGLDLTRSLVELHHGTITAQNNSDGRGCYFTVTIPLGCSHLKPEEMTEENTAEEESTQNLMDDIIVSETPAETTESPAASRRRQCIVVAEDDSEIRDYLASQLADSYDVVACANGREALAEAIRTVPDLVITDIMMPEMDGNALCTKLKSTPTTNHIPIIILTAKNLDEDQLKGLETGADAYMVKPFNMDVLRQTIVNLINTHRRLQLKYGRNDQLEQQVSDVQIKSPDDKLLDRVMTVINKNISNSDLSVDYIASEVGISRVHLHRKMKELTGQTPHEFIRNIRLKQVANLLANQNMNITEVMYACGFNNAASFSTIFKKFYGMSPREYMTEHRRREEES